MEFTSKNLPETAKPTTPSMSVAVGIDPEMLAEMEKRWAAREGLLQAEVKAVKQAVMGKLT